MASEDRDCETFRDWLEINEKNERAERREERRDCHIKLRAARSPRPKRWHSLIHSPSAKTCSGQFRGYCDEHEETKVG